MKTRIISGIVLALIVAAVLILGIYVSPAFITGFIAFAASQAIIELLKNAVGIKNKATLITAGIYVILNVFALDGSVVKLLHLNTTAIVFSILLSVIYFIIAAVICLKNQGKFSLTDIVALTSFPIVLSFAFNTLGQVLNGDNGIFYLLLLLNFSSVCDMGAYFVGSTIGKHKLCPAISPNKTVEGAVGGIVSSVIISLVLCLAFSLTDKLLAVLIFTIPFCILGMIGDLFASTIKRVAGIKDYGDLIPGHGGILDRFDSIIMIAPVLYLVISFGVI